MVSAREQAREAAYRVGDEVFGGRVQRDTVIADAASDVWEPIVRDLVAMIQGIGILSNNTSIMSNDTLRRAEEALDG